MYPSSLFFHFNIDLKGEFSRLDTPQRPILFLGLDIGKHLVMAELEEGEIPTPENTTPLDDGRGRGSVVWFNQATMFQTSELGVPTIKEAKALGLDATSDALSFIDRGLFPTVCVP